MLHSPLFFIWIGWVLVVGVIAVWRWRRVQQENAARKYPDLTGLGDLSGLDALGEVGAAW